MSARECCAVAIIERRGRLLICRRSPHARRFPGYWEFPGGKRKPRESWLACLRRELREELDVGIRRPRAVLTFRHRYPHGLIEFKVFRCRLSRGTPRPLEAAALQWVRADALPRYRFPPANRPLLRRLARAIEPGQAAWYNFSISNNNGRSVR